MESLNVRSQIELLKIQLDLEESNYKYAVELQKDYNTLYRMRENIKVLKDELKKLTDENKPQVRIDKNS